MYIGILGSVEVAIIYVLLAVDTPLAPFVRPLVEKPIGVLVLALFGLSLVTVGMWGFTSWAEWYHKKQERNDRAA